VLTENGNKDYLDVVMTLVYVVAHVVSHAVLKELLHKKHLEEKNVYHVAASGVVDI